MPPNGAKNRRLRALVKGGVLTIEIGIDTLAWSALHSNYVWQMEGNVLLDHSERYRIDDNGEFARDVIRELLAEAEDGSSLLTDLFDAATQRAIEEGSIAFVDTKERD